MARQNINTGTAPNDGTGDTLKTSFTKCNQNFIELYASVASMVGGAIISDTPPASPGGGQLWWESDGGGLYIWYPESGTASPSSQWVGVAGNVQPPRQSILTKTAAYSVALSDHNSIINVSGAAWTLSHTVTAAQAGVGFTYWIRNTGTATITIDPAGSETIDGSATLLCLVGQQFQVICDGSNWFTLGRQSKVALRRGVTSTGTGIQIVLPPDYFTFDLDVSVINNGGANSTNGIGAQFATDGVPNFIGSPYYSEQVYATGTTAAGSPMLGGAWIGVGNNVGASGNAGRMWMTVRPAGAGLNNAIISKTANIYDATGTTITGLCGGVLGATGVRATHMQVFSGDGTTFTWKYSMFGNE